MDTILVCTIFVYPHITLQEIAATTISDRFWLNACLLTLTIHHFDFRRQLADRFITVFMPSARHASRANTSRPHNVKCAVSQDHWAPPYSSHVGISSWTVGSCWICWLSSLLRQLVTSVIGHISPSATRCTHWSQLADIADIVQACSEDLRSVISRFLIKARFQEAFAETVPSDPWDLPWNCDGQDAKERLDLAEAGAVSVRWKWESVESNPSSWSKFKVQWKCLRSMFPFMSSFQSFYFCKICKGFIS